MTSAAPAPAATDEDALVPISALQHQLFCPRQCALIHLEQQWLEDGATAEGRILHERVDGGGRDQRRGARTVRGLSLRSLALGVTGKADAVELHGSAPDWRPYPIEYKRGKPKAHRADGSNYARRRSVWRKCSDARCPKGRCSMAPRIAAWRSRSMTICALTAATADAVRAMLASGRTPPPVAMPACARCSLEPLCQPKAIEARPRVSAWLARQIAD